MSKILTLLSILSLLLACILGCGNYETNYKNKIPTIKDTDLTAYNIPTSAVIIEFVRTTGQPAVKWSYLNTCYITTISLTYGSFFVSNTYPFSCE